MSKAKEVLSLIEKGKEYLDTYTDKENNVMLFIKDIGKGKYTVGVKDLDSGMSVGDDTIYPNLKAAMKKFKSEKRKM